MSVPELSLYFHTSRAVSLYGSSLPRILLDITSGTAVVKWPKTSIRTADELLAFAEAAAEYSAEDLVTVEADIDMTGKTWTPFVLECTLDGKGHKIYNISTSSSSTANFITRVEGTLKNVVFGSSDGTSYDGNSVISLTGAGQNAGVVGNNSGTLENVTSFVKVDANLSGTPASSQVRVGGIAAENNGVIHRAATAQVTISGCGNSADIFMSEQHAAENVNLGGIAGMCDALNTNPFAGTNIITSCTNSGRVYYKESRILHRLPVCIRPALSLASAKIHIISVKRPNEFPSNDRTNFRQTTEQIALCLINQKISHIFA